MLNKIKKAVVGIGLAGLCLFGATDKVEAQPQVLVTNLFAPLAGTNSWTNSLLTGGYYISGITMISGTNPTPAYVYFYDGAGTNLNNYYVSNAYFFRTNYSTNITSIQTNALGTVYTNIYPATFTAIATNSSGAYQRSPIAAFALGPNQTQTQSANNVNGGKIITVNGLVLYTTNIPGVSVQSNLTAIIYYTPNQP